MRKKSDTLVISRPHIHFNGAFLRIKGSELLLLILLFEFNVCFYYLSIKRISLQLIHTLEIMSVALCHHQTVLFSFEKVSLIQHIVATSSEVSIFLDIDKTNV